jgi:hypothetical protein
MLGHNLIWARPEIWIFHTSASESVNALEIGGTTSGFNDPNMLYANMGARMWV